MILIVTSGQSNLTKGRIAAAHGRLSRIRHMAPMCTPYTESQKWLPWQRPLAAGYRPTTQTPSI